MPEESLLTALNAERGIVCFVGAGGKKTAIGRVACAHPGRVAVTCTVRAAFFDRWFRGTTVIAPEATLAQRLREALARDRRVAYALPPEKPDRLTGVPLDLVARLHQELEFDVTYVKADGARMLWVKAPRADEPYLPPGTATVVPLISVRAVGEPAAERCVHRLEEFTRVTGCRAGEKIGVEHLARLLAGEQGACQGVGSAQVVPLINMVENAAGLVAARAIAQRALALTNRFDRVVLAALSAEQPLVEIVGRRP
jgi:probable selenium-dependent hydroxylase accessory protein YqeC